MVDKCCESVPAARPHRDPRSCSQDQLRVLLKTPRHFISTSCWCKRRNIQFSPGHSWSILEAPSPSWLQSGLQQNTRRESEQGVPRGPQWGDAPGSGPARRPRPVWGVVTGRQQPGGAGTLLSVFPSRPESVCWSWGPGRGYMRAGGNHGRGCGPVPRQDREAEQRLPSAKVSGRRALHLQQLVRFCLCLPGKLSS